MGHPLVSIVIPMLNEEGNLEELHRVISNTFSSSEKFRYEIVFVDDGSTDGSAACVKELAASDDRVRLVSLSRNFGTQMAIFAGLEYARGDAVIVMDADLQHPPALALEMIDLWLEGYEVVYAVRDENKDVGFFRKMASSTFSWIFESLIDLNIDRNACDFRLLDRKVVQTVTGMRERSRFFRGLVSWAGFRQTGVSYVAEKRFSGETKWNLTKLLGLAADAITSFSRIPLRLCTYLGFFTALSVIPYALWAIYQRIFELEGYRDGFAATIVAILFLGGVQLISLGVVGEYVGRIYDEVKRRPLYVARETIGFDNNDDFGSESELAQELQTESAETSQA